METYPKAAVDVGEERKQVLFGGQRAAKFIKDIVAGRAVDGRRYGFDSDFVISLHDRVSMAPGVRGMFRQTDSTTIGGDPVRAHFEDLPGMMRLFGRWLEEQMQSLKEKPEDIVMALQTAAGAHYGLTMPDFHPFDNGNGRTARALMNAILMFQSYELTAFGLAIPPIPIIRSQKDEGHYIRSLKAVGKTKTLNPFMTFIASKWIESLDERLRKIQSLVNLKTKADQNLIDKLKRRKELLEQFVQVEKRRFPIPDYFGSRYVRFSNADTL